MQEAAIEKDDQELKYKMANIDKAIKLLFKYDDYVTEARWDAYFNLPFQMYLNEVADANMRIFMGKGFASDYKVTDHRRPMTEVRKVYPKPAEEPD